MSRFLIALLLTLGHAQTTLVGPQKIMGPVTIPRAVSNLVYFWPGNEGSGLTLHDTVAANNITAGSGAFTWSTYSGALTTAVPDYQATGNAQVCAPSATGSNFTVSQPFTFWAWYYFPDVTSTMVLIDTRPSSGNGGVVIYVETAINEAFMNVNGNINLSGSNTATANTLTLVMLTYDGSGNGTGWKQYVNGSATSTGSGTGNVTGTLNAGQPVCIGDGTTINSVSGNAVFSVGVANVDESANAAYLFGLGPFVKPAW